MSSTIRSNATFGLFGCIVMFLGVVALYWPGIYGAFIFDDFNTLKPLSNWSGVGYFEKLWLYISSGQTGPGGRPISLLTFYFNSTDWPADPKPFIITNIVIHALNAVLVYWLVSKVAHIANVPTGKAAAVALLSAALWVLHPLHSSTVIYIVQRMTLLSACFSFLTLLMYLYARSALINECYPRVLMWGALTAAMAGLAFFSKENAVLLPLQLLLLECVLRRFSFPKSTFYKIAIVVFLIIPSLIIVGYLFKILLGHLLNYWATGVEQTYGRSFTLLERLYTQQRILGDYWIALLFPKMQSSGVFFDRYLVSTSLFNPISTLFWACFHLTVLLFAWVYRQRVWWLCFGVFWFYVSHLIESTVVMLELKFEHRNYLPSVGLMVILAAGLCSINHVVLRRVVIGSVIAFYSFLLFMSASLWGNPLKAALVWAQENPTSYRVYDHATLMAIKNNAPQELTKHLAQKSIELSSLPAQELKYMLAFCETYDGKEPNWQSLAHKIATTERDWSIYPILEAFIKAGHQNNCQLLSFDGYKAMLDAYRANPVYADNLSVVSMDELEILAAFYFDMSDHAMDIENNRDELLVPLAFKMKRAGIFASYGYLEFAIEKLEIAIAVAEKLGNESQFNIRNAREMLQLMRVDLESKNYE